MCANKFTDVNKFIMFPKAVLLYFEKILNIAIKEDG